MHGADAENVIESLGRSAYKQLFGEMPEGFSYAFPEAEGSSKTVYNFQIF